MVALEANGLCKQFGQRRAVREASVRLERGEVLAIIGPNGAGKTTLLSMLAGRLEPSSGELRLATPGAVGWVPQQAAVYSKLSVAENLRLFARLEGVGDLDRAVAAMLEQSGLRDRADEEVGRLSGGNRQRVNIAVGLIADPTVLLLDEPSAALDPRQRARLWEFIGARVAGGTSVAFTTHDVAEAERYAGALLILADGEVLFSGPPSDLGRSPAGLERAFVDFLAERGH
jgi:ABC-2 type transport system ATP-binding protein